jgi:dTDP-L-rhamnose 4-epimerase
VSRNILITGGEGFIGSKLALRLLKAGQHVVLYGRSTPSWSPSLPVEKNLVVIHGDLCEQEHLEEALDGVEIIFHKASSYTSTGNDSNDWLTHSNVSGTASLIAALEKNGKQVKKIILDSSISVYGEGRYFCAVCGDVRPRLRTISTIQECKSFEPPCPKCGARVEPTLTRESDDLNGSSAYACSKRMQEQLLMDASSMLGFNLIIFRYATVYGANQRETNPYARFIKAISKGEPVTLNEDGFQKRDFVYVDDVITANELSMNNDFEGCLVLNFGTGSETPLWDFIYHARSAAQVALSCAPSEIKITSELVTGDIRHCKIDCTQARAILGYVPLISWREGINLWLHEYIQGTQRHA